MQTLTLNALTGHAHKKEGDYKGCEVSEGLAWHISHCQVDV